MGGGAAPENPALLAVRRIRALHLFYLYMVYVSLLRDAPPAAAPDP